jgi:hypothetical protein
LSQNFRTWLFYFLPPQSQICDNSLPLVNADTNMLSKIREILLTQYIGAILVALLGSQAVSTVIIAVARNGFWYFDQRHNQSVLATSGPPFPWENLIFSLVTVLLYLLAAYSLARWLFPAAPLSPAVGHDEAERPDQPEP